MTYKNLDINDWNRKKQYEFFKKYDNPFFNICTTLDVTQLIKTTKSNQLPFSTCMLFASIDTANKIEEFKYRIKDDGVIEYDSIYAGSTLLNDDNTFSFSYFDYYRQFSKFNINAQKQIALNKRGLLEFDGRNEDLDIIHYSIIPWISFTSFSHPRNYRTNDSIPKIVFGKYFVENGRFRMPIAVEVHHALMDGYHLGLYFTKLQEMINNLGFIQK